jgi:hypothetical protein
MMALVNNKILAGSLTLLLRISKVFLKSFLVFEKTFASYFFKTTVLSR